MKYFAPSSLFKPLYQRPLCSSRNMQTNPLNLNEKGSLQNNISVQSKKPQNRNAMNLSKLIVFLIIFIPLFDRAESVTFFYGVSEPGHDEGLKPLEEDAIIPSESTLTNEEMYSAYRFCELLPHLENIGRVKKNKETREVCDRLVAILHPMFRRADDKVA